MKLKMHFYEKSLPETRIRKASKSVTFWASLSCCVYLPPWHSPACSCFCTTLIAHSDNSDAAPLSPGRVLFFFDVAAAAAAKSLQLCPTLCDPRDGSPPGSPIPGILQARTLEWVASSFSNAWKRKVKAKSFSRVRLFVTPWTAAYQAPPSMGSSRRKYWSGLPLPSPFTTEPAVKPTQTSILITILLLQCLAHKWKERKWKKDGGREEKRQEDITNK